LRKESKWAGITANTLLLFIAAQGLKSCLKMNGKIFFKRRSANGFAEFFENIDISVPMTAPVGGMIPVNVRGCERMNLRELADAVADVRRRMKKTDFNEVMFETGLGATLKTLRQGRADIVLARLLGAAFGKAKTPLLKGRARRDYYAVPETERLAARDLEPGTITVSNFGSLYGGATPVLLEIIPPQICVIGVGPLTERPGCVTVSGEKKIAPRKFIAFNILFDHRALDYGDVVPFMKRLDEIFARPEDLKFWL
jgi:pyruvate dehydrogenase E2 component (dihydrolipoamide acetyltransferase)